MCTVVLLLIFLLLILFICDVAFGIVQKPGGYHTLSQLDQDLQVHVLPQDHVPDVADAVAMCAGHLGLYCNVLHRVLCLRSAWLSRILIQHLRIPHLWSVNSVRLD